MTLETPAEPGNPRSLVERLDAATSQPVQPRRVRGSGVELRVGIVLWPGFPLLSLAGLCDGLRHAADLGDQSRQRRCSWTIFGVPGTSVTDRSSCWSSAIRLSSCSSRIDAWLATRKRRNTVRHLLLMVRVQNKSGFPSSLDGNPA